MGLILTPSLPVRLACSFSGLLPLCGLRGHSCARNGFVLTQRLARLSVDREDAID
jgi:hypothetical protein